MNANEAVTHLIKTRYTVREIAALLQAGGVQVSYSTISRIHTDPGYITSKQVARRLIKLAQRTRQ